jgi:hypothetical protein
MLNFNILLRIIVSLTFVLSFCCSAVISQESNIQRFFDFETKDGRSYSDLRLLCKTVGHRLSGSTNASKAVDWAKATMESIVPGNVRLQSCVVPHWERGRPEVCVLNIWNGDSIRHLNVLALGGSEPTPSGGVEADVVEVRNFDELQKLGKQEITGKIVFFNHFMDSTLANTFDAYGKAVAYRWKGPSEAARYGAVASVVRSMNTRTDDFPHTGVMMYNDSFPKIPCFAISTADAKNLSLGLQKHKEAKLYLLSNCRWLTDEPSFNVIGEIKGTVYPNEIITVGGHLDSWDVGEGAHDDGAGVVQSISVLNILNQLGLKPKRTIRVVAFMNEENGGKGGKAYSEGVLPGEKHIAALETDEGAGYPQGFGIGGVSQKSRQMIETWKEFFKPFGINRWENDGGGSDLGELKKKTGVPTLNLIPDPTKYFHYHHTANDVFENINENDLKAGAAAITALVWLISENGLEAEKVKN